MTMRIDFAKFAIPHDATNDELRDWINELYTMWANTSDLLAEYQEDEYVKVVRCRDCDFSYEDELGNLRCRGLLTEPWDYYNDEPSDGVKVEPSGFCAWAERK